MTDSSLQVGYPIAAMSKVRGQRSEALSGKIFESPADGFYMNRNLAELSTKYQVLGTKKSNKQELI